MSVEVTNESAIPVGEARLAAIASFVLGELGINPLAELSVLIVDVPHMAALNERWMNEEGPTDVLAFPMDELTEADRPGVAPADVDQPDDDPAVLGDIVLCPAVAISQAAAAGHSFEEELQMLITHGILHLLGYDHMEPGDEREMFALQTKLLTKWRSAAAS